MTSKIIIFFYFFLISSVISQKNRSNSYNEFIENLVNIKVIEKQIREFSPDIPDSVLLTMIDASSKLPSGILNGNFFDLGNFDECYNIHYGDKYGKYCLGTIFFTSMAEKYRKFLNININDTKKLIQMRQRIQPRTIQLDTAYTGLHLARCVPSDMSAKNISRIQTFTEELCYSKATEPELSGGAIAVIAVLSIFAVIVVASTAFDIYLQVTDKTAPHELFIAFSWWTNGRKIFKSSKNPDQLLCLNGIKAISMMWVIIGHEFSLSMNAPISNFFDLLNWQKESASMYIVGATVSVDTFFVVGGLVTVYTYLKSMDKGVKFNIFLYYIHRYLRLTPALIIVALIHLYLLNYISIGPLWKTVDYSLVKTCEKSWWSTFLYINNYIHKEVCVPQTWYLDVDMQLYVLSPIILIPLFQWPIYTLGVMGVLAIAGCVVPLVITYEENLGIGMNMNMNKPDYMNDYYVQTYTRFGPYVIGTIAGYFLYKIKKKDIIPRLSKPIVYTLWLVLVTGLTACVWAEHPLIIATEEDKWGDAFFNGFNRPAWAVCVAGVIFLCVAGYGKPIDSFLSWPIFQVLTKLSYSMYLVHFAIISIRVASLKNLVKFSNLAWMHMFWADFAVTFLFAAVLCLSFESPIIILEKYLFGKGKPQINAQSQQKKPEV